MAYVQLSADQCRAREQAIVDRHAKLKRDPHPAILADRAARFKEHIEAMTIRPAIEEWAENVSKAYGRKVRVHHTVTDWVTALMIIRYGEAEYHWPLEFSDEDVQRADEIEGGKLAPYIQLIADDPS